MTGRRLIGCCLGLAVALVVLVPQGAGAILVHDWNGKIKGDPDSFVTFNVKKTNSGVKRVRDVTFGGLAITCDGGIQDEADGVFLQRKFRVRHRKFGGKSAA